MINNDMASLSSSLRPNNPLGTNNLSSKGRLILVNIHRNIGLIPIRTGLEEILSQGLGRRKLGEGCSSSEEGGTGGNDFFGVVYGFDDFDHFLGLFGGDGSWGEAGGGEGD
jgi:hypothetical protein